MSAIAEPMSSVTIFMKQLGRGVEQYDREDQCMKTIVDSFEILNSNDTSGHYISGCQIVLHLRNITISAKYVKEDGSEIDYRGDQETDIVGLAVESVLKHLYKADCVCKDAVTFQSRCGSYQSGDIKISGISAIVCNPKASSSYSINSREGIVSHSYAYLKERRACIFLNNPKPDILKKIDAVLAKLLLRKAEKERTMKLQEVGTTRTLWNKLSSSTWNQLGSFAGAVRNNGVLATGIVTSVCALAYGLFHE